MEEDHLPAGRAELRPQMNTPPAAHHGFDVSWWAGLVAQGAGLPDSTPLYCLFHDYFIRKCIFRSLLHLIWKCILCL